MTIGLLMQMTLFAIANGFLFVKKETGNRKKTLLSNYGVIFISIDDNEYASLKILCDEILGYNNFINNFMWLHGKGKKNKQSRTLQQYILAYSKINRDEFTLTKEQRTMITDLRDPRKALSSIASYFKDTFGLTGNKKENKTRPETAGFVFSDSINTYTQSGSVATLSDLGESDNLNTITVKETVNTHKLGRVNQHCVGLIAREIGIEPAMTHTILRRLFCDKSDYYNKFLALSTRELYAFIINNVDLLRRNFREAMAVQLSQGVISPDMVSKKEFVLPRACKFTYDSASKVQTESVKNVYQGYLMSAEPRSTAEKKFEKFCEKCSAVNWIYKNGDKGDEYLSIVYLDNGNRQKLFYPDYIVSVNDETWIIETKGGFDKAGNSEDIDIFSPKKFEVLKAYLEKYGLKGGFVRFDKNSDELCICTEKNIAITLSRTIGNYWIRFFCLTKRLVGRRTLFLYIFIIKYIYIVNFFVRLFFYLLQLFFNS
ncbi:MAG: hypothetical protein L6V79_02470 [Clostridium sp.]|nr:MAG: hypothetical protein L6V79_02470 [Clostridium sp.]